MSKQYPTTPDGRYFVAKARLWRKTNPALDDATRRGAVKALMQARRAMRDARTEEQTKDLRARVDSAKRDLGERGPVWWADGAPDESGRHPKNTAYAEWWAGLDAETQARGL